MGALKKVLVVVGVVILLFVITSFLFQMSTVWKGKLV